MTQKNLKLKRIGVLSLAKFSAMFYFILGLIILAVTGAMMLLMMIFPALIAIIGGDAGTIAGVLALGVGGALMYLLWAVFMIILYTIIGVIVGVVVALVYNLVAKLSGGITVSVEEEA